MNGEMRIDDRGSGVAVVRDFQQSVATCGILAWLPVRDVRYP
jgi:hypothetical protein